MQFAVAAWPVDRHIESANRRFLLSIFRLPDLIAQLGGPFVVFGFDGLRQFLAQPGEIDLPLDRHAGAAAAGGHFADVVRRAFVGPLQQRRQVFLKSS